jgi:XRE family aerobic/anaerobic benzoate catabolism transcriptional regulator
VRTVFLGEVGEKVRRRREALGLTRRQLAERSGLSERFLADLERGDGNISLVRFVAVAEALGQSAADLLAPVQERGRRPIIALLGLRGAGKSTVGTRLAARVGVPFVELDDRIERTAGLSLGEIFELHGEVYYRRLERETLRTVLAEAARGAGAVVATGGSLVTDQETFELLRGRALTLWLRARPEDHWDRVIKQGDERPMAKNPHAFAELRALLRAREPLYRAADHVIETTGTSVDDVVERALAAATSA